MSDQELTSRIKDYVLYNFGTSSAGDMVASFGEKDLGAYKIVFLQKLRRVTSNSALCGIDAGESALEDLAKEAIKRDCVFVADLRPVSFYHGETVGYAGTGYILKKNSE